MYTAMGMIKKTLLLVISLSTAVNAAPQRNGGRTAQQQAAQIPGGVSQAKDGSVIMDTIVTVNNLNLRVRMSGPANAFKAAVGGNATQNATSGMGINVLLHGDGGQSFFDFPNQGVQNNLMGVAVLAPDPNLFWGGGSGLQRTNGAAHSKAVSDLVTTMIPQMLAFNQSQVFFTGVSGGALMLSGFFVPQEMSKFGGTAVMLNCGALAPQVAFAGDSAALLSTTQIHFQSTQNELAILQTSIPQSITAYQQLASQAGLNADQINQLQTADNTPVGGHCAFDGQGFVSGVQLMADSFGSVLQGGNGEVVGVGNVKTGVVGTTLQFGAPA